ncbi:kelch repeat-containing protein [Amycolatopsis sp., V23-08]|uniref:Kelch repeat-containing protein n=1 Tax=Amycolatopsis heterodermiae TaxID=3110235 RepID=A0ABU5RDR7_9PSEU|nr:kelch repeat-containing protein [Amycolatopsis sp., V23-08]MEA5364411.1 kelch repeat-containing protein [Amycolatopsis sp., V23-08]
MTESWKHRPPLRSPRFAHEVARAGDDLFVIGGTDGNTAHGSVETRKVTGSGEWQHASPMPVPRTDLAVGVAGGRVYAAGGTVGEAATDVVDRYDPLLDEWSPAAPLPAPLASASAAGLGGKLYVAGGSGTGEPATDAVLGYDPEEKRWDPVAPMRTPRARFRLLATETHLYAIGGLTGGPWDVLDSVERYSPETDTWETVAPMHKRRVLPGVALLGDRIVVVGGAPAAEDPGARDRTTEVLDLGTGAWHLLGTLLPHGRSSVVCVAGPAHRILAIGGRANVFGRQATVSDVLSLKVP